MATQTRRRPPVRAWSFVAGIVVLASTAGSLLGPDDRVRLASTVVLALAGLAAAGLAAPRRQVAGQMPSERHDPLTGLATRPVLHERLAQAIASNLRLERTVGVLLVELDGFGDLTRDVRQDIADRLLMEVASRLGHEARRTDLLCRHGGHEFVLLAEHLRDQADAAVVADRVLATVRDPITVAGRTFRLTASIGVGLHPDDTADPGELLRLASTAMVEARRAGGDTYRFSSIDLRDDRLTRRTTLGELRDAIERNDLLLAYQPQIDLRSGHVVSAEALLRWRRDRSGEPVAAGRFIALTENTELAERIGQFVLNRAIADVVTWHARPGGEGLTVSVNVGMHHLRHGDLVADVARTLDQHGVAGRFLELEIPEDAIGQAPEAVLPVLLALRELGVRLVLDDFGAGQTALGRLPDLPLNALKLDTTLSNRLAGSGAGMVAGLVGLGRELGLQVVIPRIEHVGQLRRARQLGCHRAQGFLVSPPLPTDMVRGGPAPAIAGRIASAVPSGDLPGATLANPSVQQAAGVAGQDLT